MRVPAWLRPLRDRLTARPAKSPPRKVARRLRLESLEDRTVPATISLVSTTASAGLANQDSNTSAISADGHYAVFLSRATNLVPNDTNSSQDLFRKDLQTGAIVRVNTKADGSQASGDIYDPSISADGRYVAFLTLGTLVPGGGGMFRKDLTTGALASVASNAAGVATTSQSTGTAISADGRYVAFQSFASNLVPGDTNGQSDVFRKDLSNGAIVLVSTTAAGVQSNNFSRAVPPTISADGRYVAFETNASNLVAGDTNFRPDIYRKDLSDGTVVRVSLDSSGLQQFADATNPRISADGAYVTFDGGSGAVRKDLNTGALALVGTSAAGVAGNDLSYGGGISADGRFVAIYSAATNLVAGDTNGQFDVFRKDLTTGEIVRVSVSGAGVQGTNTSFEPSISADGVFVTFTSRAANLVAGDTNAKQDVFRWEADALAPQPDITLSAASVAENLAAGSAVGTFAGVNVPAGATFALVPAALDNAAFQVVGGQLRTAAAFDFEAKASYAVRVEMTYSGGTLVKDFAVGVTNVNEGPTSVTLLGVSVGENLPVGTGVGTLSGTDPDAGDILAFSLVPGFGDNAAFSVTGGSLRSAATFDFETKSSYSIRVQATDVGGLTVTADYTVTVTNANDPPSLPVLSNATVAENSAVGATVGTLSTTDPDAGDAVTFSLVAGALDNAAFGVTGTTLTAAASFNFEAKASYAVRVRATDAGGLSSTRDFSIGVIDLNEAPTAVSLSSSSVSENPPAGSLVGTLSGTDPDAGNTLVFSLFGSTGDNAAFQIVGGQLQTKAALDFEAKASYTGRVRASDGALRYIADLTVAVLDAPESPTALSLSRVFVPEGIVAGTVIGTLAATDPDAGSVFAFGIPADGLFPDNALFVIDGVTLKAAPDYPFAAGDLGAFTIKVRVTDATGNAYDREFTVTQPVTSDIAFTLASAAVTENAPAGTAVGAFISATPGVTYTLLPSFADNAQFHIVGGVLQTLAAFDFEAKSQYLVGVYADDGTDSGEAYFVVAVGDVREVTGFDVQKGLAQRSFVRFVDVTLDNAATAAHVISAGPGGGPHVKLTRYTLTGVGAGVDVALTGALSVTGDTLGLDFGSGGLAADGYYVLGIDLDGDGSFETEKRFYRLQGDVNGDRKVDSRDAQLVSTAIGQPYNAAFDVDGDGDVDAADRTLAIAARNKRLGAGLSIDD